MVQEIWHDLLESLDPDHYRGLLSAGLTAEALTRGLNTLDSDPTPQVCTDGADFVVDQPLAPQLDSWLNSTWLQFLELWPKHSRTLEACFCTAAAEWKAAGASRTTPYSAKPRSDRCAVIDQWIAAQATAPSISAIRDQEKPLKEYFHPGSWCRVARSCGEEEPSLAHTELQTVIAALWDGPIERVWRHCLQRGLAKLND